VAVVRRHPQWVSRIGAGLLAAVGVALLTGFWGEFTTWLLTLIQATEVSI
jgi:hypothetical protein